MNPYSNNKVINHADRLIEIKRGGHPAPVHVYFVISNVCNHGCSFCLYRMDGEISNQMFDSKEMIPVTLGYKLLSEFKELGVKAVQFTGGGEPTVHPDFSSFLSYAHNLELETALVTNGQRITEDMLYMLMESVWVRVSLDAGTAETHARIRRISSRSFDMVIHNLERLVTRVSKIGSKLHIGISFVVTKENWEEIVGATQLAKSLGVAYIRFATRNSYPEGFAYYNGISNEIKEKLYQAVELQTDDFQVHDTFDERLVDLEQGHPDYSFCTQQRLSTYVGADLNVYRCCVTAYNEFGLLGSLENGSMVDLWNDEETVNNFAQFNAKNCPRCQFNIKNRGSISIMDSISLDHVNFY